MEFTESPAEQLNAEDLAAEQMRLRRTSVRGVAITMSTQLLRFFLRFGYQVLIARLLLPKDFGLVAMAGPAISFIQLFTDLGLSQATIQHKEISQQQLSFLFWVSLCAGAIFAVITTLFAPLVADFYHEPRLTTVMVALGGMLFLTGCYSQHMALLYRRMNYRVLGIIDITNFCAGALAGLGAAWLGAGYWSIVINQAVSTLVALVMAWAATGWVPGKPGPYAEMRPLLHFGGNITGFNIVNFFSRNSDNILIGRFCGPYPLGLYDRAFKLMLLPFGQISAPFSAVAVPMLAKSREQPEFYRNAFRRMLEAVLLLLYPGIAFMIVCSHDLVILALGARWVDVAPIFALLGFDALVSPIGNSMGWLFVSQGRTREMRDWGILASLIFVADFIIGLHWGPRGVAAAYAISGFIEISFLWKIATRSGPLRERDFLRILLPYVVALPASFGFLLGVHPHMPDTFWAIGAQAIGSYIVFAGGLCLTPGGRRLLADGLRRLRALSATFRRPSIVAGE
ncbi:lipopolysaccharide biosynthesis protein [Acidocella sp.]|uniref:lipopolysaccharide biosynthesis protein n=1 Tax=Acidocella sp. TaxID=50710 RepID=UPI002621D094|nr:lipopolysaccharide biosynthesis protein [Acidocella sp.]